jgi:hypothetical protein
MSRIPLANGNTKQVFQLTKEIYGKFLIELIEYLPKTPMTPYIWGQILNPWMLYISGQMEYIIAELPVSKSICI